MKLIKVAVPQYNLEQELDTDAIGKIVDDEIKKHFLGKSIVVRGVASSEHPDKTQDELIEIIEQTGTDRYDPERKGDRYENVKGKRIDLFGFPLTVTGESDVFGKIVWGFYHSAKEIHGRPMKIDIVIIYDANQMAQVLHQYEGRDDIKDDGFVFKTSENKQDALVGIIKIT